MPLCAQSWSCGLNPRCTNEPRLRHAGRHAPVRGYAVVASYDLASRSDVFYGICRLLSGGPCLVRLRTASFGSVRSCFATRDSHWLILVLETRHLHSPLAWFFLRWSVHCFPPGNGIFLLYLVMHLLLKLGFEWAPARWDTHDSIPVLVLLTVLSNSVEPLFFRNLLCCPPTSSLLFEMTSKLYNSRCCRHQQVLLLISLVVPPVPERFSLLYVHPLTLKGGPVVSPSKLVIY